MFASAWTSILKGSGPTPPTGSGPSKPTPSHTHTHMIAGGPSLRPKPSLKKRRPRTQRHIDGPDARFPNPRLRGELPNDLRTSHRPSATPNDLLRGAEQADCACRKAASGRYLSNGYASAPRAALRGGCRRPRNPESRFPQPHPNISEAVKRTRSRPTPRPEHGRPAESPKERRSCERPDFGPIRRHPSGSHPGRHPQTQPKPPATLSGMRYAEEVLAAPTGRQVPVQRDVDQLQVNTDRPLLVVFQVQLPLCQLLREERQLTLLDCTEAVEKGL